MTRDDALAAHAARAIRDLFAGQKRQAEGAMAQLDPADFHRSPDPDSNSIAVIVRHLAGNMRSRWTDPLTTDGEKPDRHRDLEFVDDDASREAILARWEEGWGVLFAALDDLLPARLLTPVRIRGEEHTVFEALLRQASHYAEHVGQIVYLAKHLKGDDWSTLSIPRADPGDGR